MMKETSSYHTYHARKTWGAVEVLWKVGIIYYMKFNSDDISDFRSKKYLIVTLVTLAKKQGER